MARQIGAHDWAKTALGPLESWAPQLKALVQVILGSIEPMFIAWGPARTLLYNDPYSKVLANKHPALGQDFLDVWSEIRGDLEPLVAKAYAGVPTRMDDIELVMERKGYPERTHWHYSYTPVRLENGAIGGFLCSCHEITQQIAAERRQATLLTLEAALRSARTPQGMLDAACEALARAVDGDVATFSEFGDGGSDGEVTGEWRTASATLGHSPRTGRNGGHVAERPERLESPLVREGRVRAILAVGAAKARRWSSDDVALARAIGERSWEAVERARAEALASRAQFDRKRAEADLREQEERLRLATDHAEVGFWDVDEINHRLHWPPLVKAMFGISPDVPVTMQSFYEGLHPEDREATTAAYLAAADPMRRSLYDVEYRTVGKEDGIVRWVAAKGRGVFDSHGVCLRVVGTAIDITRRKLAEEQLRELNDTLERRVAEALAGRKVLADVVDGSDLFVQVADLDYNWLAINRAASREFSRIFGVPPPRSGDNMLALLQAQPEHLAEVRRVWSRALGGEEFVQVDTFGNPSLDRRCYEMRFRSLRDGSGRLVGAYQFVADVTDRLREQHRLKETEAALAQAQKMEAVGQLTGGIAHDFNNLLQSVAGSLDLIRRKPDDAERVQRWAEKGFTAAQRGAKLTGQLLAFSRAQKIELKPVALSALISAFRDMIDRTIGAHIRVTLDLGADGIPVLGDEVQIEMAVLNLALNARDAMPDGGELAIRTRQARIEGDGELADGDYVELAVRDTGTGMPPEVAARAFDPFFTTKGVGKGTGLGLSQVYAAMRQVGGAVRIETRPGGGTTVRLFFRRTEGVEASPAAEASAQQKDVRPARVLIVDDDPDVRQFLVESLDVLGFAVIQAEDGQAGLAELERSAPDLMILDFAMPGMNGAEVIKRVRQSRPDLPIILITGFAESDAIDAIVRPDLPVLRKPFGMDGLRQAIELALHSLK